MTRKFEFKTTKTSHKECMDKLADKCNWEQRTRLYVLAEWPDIVCADCRQEMDIKEIA